MLEMFCFSWVPEPSVTLFPQFPVTLGNSCVQTYSSKHPDLRLAKGHLYCLLFPLVCSGAESSIDYGSVEGQLSDPIVKV